MLAALTVKDIVLIEQAALEFAPGLNVLTGETGAGKSILLDALGLAAGGRSGGRAGVRPGAGQGSAVAVFEPAPDHHARDLLKAQSMPHEGEIILRHYAELSFKEIAALTNCSINTALGRMRYGLINLRKMMVEKQISL